jgi:hypothetical protein
MAMNLNVAEHWYSGHVVDGVPVEWISIFGRGEVSPERNWRKKRKGKFKKGWALGKEG